MSVNNNISPEHAAKLEAVRRFYFGLVNGENSPTTVNEVGGAQSKLHADMTLLPIVAVHLAATVLTEGASKYGRDNWTLIPVNDHVNHAIAHMLAWLADQKSDHHLHHAMCRLMFASEAAALEAMSHVLKEDNQDAQS